MTDLLPVRINGQRQHQGCATPAGRNTGRGMQNGFRLGRVQQLHDEVLITHFKRPVKKAWLAIFDDAGETDGGQYIGEGLVRAFVSNVVGRAEVLQSEAGLDRFMLRPFDSIGAQGIAHPGQVDQVPAGIVVFILPFIGIVKIPVKEIAAEFIIETDCCCNPRCRCWAPSFQREFWRKILLR